MTTSTEIALLAGGCFWGMQELIRMQPGVLSTRVGYSGGEVDNATYRNHGNHAEAIEIVFAPAQASVARENSTAAATHTGQRRGCWTACQSTLSWPALAVFVGLLPGRASPRDARRRSARPRYSAAGVQPLATAGPAPSGQRERVWV